MTYSAKLFAVGLQIPTWVSKTHKKNQFLQLSARNLQTDDPQMYVVCPRQTIFPVFEHMPYECLNVFLLRKISGHPRSTAPSSNNKQGLSFSAPLVCTPASTTTPLPIPYSQFVCSFIFPACPHSRVISTCDALLAAMHFFVIERHQPMSSYMHWNPGQNMRSQQLQTTESP